MPPQLYKQIFMQKCTLSFKSFHIIYIKKSIQYIFQAFTIWGIPVRTYSFVSQPTKYKRYTLLRSPHIDKKSREQLEWVKKKAELILFFNKISSVLFLIFLLQCSQFPGVQITISLNGGSLFTHSFSRGQLGGFIGVSKRS